MAAIPKEDLAPRLLMSNVFKYCDEYILDYSHLKELYFLASNNTVPCNDTVIQRFESRVKRAWGKIVDENLMPLFLRATSFPT